MAATVLQIICAVLGLVVSVSFAYQVIYLFIPMFLHKKRNPGPGKQIRYGVLIAARNEEAVIGHLIDSIHQQSYPQELLDVFVVADNCTDSTAALARSHGAQVYERFHKELIGKGRALDYLLTQLKEEGKLQKYDAFLIFDADNVLSPDYIAQINKVADQGFRVFSGYRNSKNFGDNWISAGHAMWYLHDSCHLNRSRMLLGASCIVTGTGYGFTRELLEEIGGWHFFTLTEDIEFSTWCITRGIKIGYAHNAVLYDEQPNTLAVSWRQRIRWAQGGIQVTFKAAKDLPMGFKRKGWAAWSTFESATLSLWGYGTAGLCGFLSLITAVVSGGLAGFLISMAGGLVGTYLSMFAIAVLTLITEGKKIRATRGQKLMAAFSFPLYVATYLLTAVCSIFYPFEWKPIEHKVAISAQSLQK